ncbi:MAG: DUF2442 domain-containing protein [Planctomycetes bacterium]|nr:DUF2442 domain-containing protein [Planctomycetota bacterium]
MTTSTLTNSPEIQHVEATDELLCVRLSDGRTVTVPIIWYPRLSHAHPRHRGNWELIGRGHGIHWPDLDEDISVENILLGRPSGECASSFARWKKWYRQKGVEPAAQPRCRKRRR